jgi:hypothetical protein
MTQSKKQMTRYVLLPAIFLTVQFHTVYRTTNYAAIHRRTPKSTGKTLGLCPKPRKGTSPLDPCRVRAAPEVLEE